MSLWLEDKYANLLSPQLERFRRVDSNTYNFRCPICGDSAKNKFKARGYIYRSKDHLSFSCKNCGAFRGFVSFLKEIDSRLYQEYRLETLKESGRTPWRKRDQNPEPEKEEETSDVLRGLTPVVKFAPGHPVRKYVEDRKIPVDQLDRFLYVNRFMEWVNTIIPNKFTEAQLKMDEPRLVIPFADANGHTFAVTGRSFKANSIKYITIKFNEDVDKIYGLDRVDPSKRVYVFEGPIDSMFIDNSIAMAGSSGKLPRFEDEVIVLDNEPRNRDIVRLNEKLIDDSRTICIWPDNFEFKDVNESIEAGWTAKDVKDIIDKNTFHGLGAKLRLYEWKKIDTKKKEEK